MNDPLAAPAFTEAEKEEPPSWPHRLWEKLQEKFHGKAELVALHEAVDELLNEAGEADGTPNAERVLLNNILTLRNKEVVDCMVPRAQIVAIDVDNSLKDLVALMAERTYSRIPVYRETLDDTIGMIHMKDVVSCLAEGKTPRLRDLLRPIFFVAPSMPASKLLLKMRQARQHMAMVVDEFGGIDGLVTIEDLVEEIVGDIEDEHDTPATTAMIARADGTLLVDAGTAIETIEERLGTLLTQEERETIDTLAGYVFHLAGHIPQIGETVEGPRGLLFDVLETDETRIKRVRVRGTRMAAKES